MSNTTQPKPGTKADLAMRLDLAEQLIDSIIRMGERGMDPAEIADRARVALELFIISKR